MNLRVENIVFFPKKMDFMIVRGGRFRYGSFTTKEGTLVIKLKGFDRYYFDPATDQVYSRRNGRSFIPLTVQTRETKPYYWLYKNGISQKVYKWEILRDNSDQIENFSPDSEHDPVEKNNVSKMPA